MVVSALRARIRAALGPGVQITGWSYRLLAPHEHRSARAAAGAARGAIGDAGDLRVLLAVDGGDLDPVADAEAITCLRRAPAGTRPAYEIAYRTGGWRRLLAAGWARRLRPPCRQG
ncbi:hypothetical protein GCM10014719_55350 [Planomonospora parontospora subsp. antibiotica]|nr:hypothetical protein GCM10014719_55350 [Planomonospora parontospora subsp. antibiotica]